MKRAHLVLGIACVLSGCAAASASRVRDIDGNPLPPYAFADSNDAVLKVHCADGHGYLVVTDPPPYLYGARFAQVIRLVHRDPATVCDRILASRI